MLDKLEPIIIKYEEVRQKLSDPDVVSDMKEYTRLSKEFKELSDVKDVYDRYKDIVSNIDANKDIIANEKDEEFRDMAKLELSDLEPQKEQLEEEIKILLVPKDPEDGKDVMLEIRGGTGGDEAAIFAEYAQLTGYKQSSQPRALDLALLAQQDYAKHQPQQWPITALDAGSAQPELQSQVRLFTDGQFLTKSGKANFIAISYQAAASKISADFPMILNTGRNRDQWHSMSRTGLSTRLNGHMPEPLLSINPDDLAELNILDGSIVQVESPQGKLLVRTHSTENQNSGELFLPIHWSKQNASAGAISSLVLANTDPISGQPENKYTAVNIQPWQHASRAALWSQRRLQVESTLPDADYWIERRLDQGFLYYLASTAEPAVFFNQLKQTLQNSYMEKQVDYQNQAAQKFRFAMSLQANLHLSLMVAAANDQDDESWLADLTVLLPDVGFRSTLKGQALTPSSRIVCACHQVSEHEIKAAVKSGAENLEAVGRSCKAGTGCGSCLPEVQRVMESCDVYELA